MGTSPHPVFKWINRIPGNLKGDALGLCRWIRAKHLVPYLAEALLTA